LLSVFYTSTSGTCLRIPYVRCLPHYFYVIFSEITFSVLQWTSEKQFRLCKA
jgi:hypothetical protein